MKTENNKKIRTEKEFLDTLGEMNFIDMMRAIDKRKEEIFNKVKMEENKK